MRHSVPLESRLNTLFRTDRRSWRVFRRIPMVLRRTPNACGPLADLSVPSRGGSDVPVGEQVAQLFGKRLVELEQRPEPRDIVVDYREECLRLRFRDSDITVWLRLREVGLKLLCRERLQARNAVVGALCPERDDLDVVAVPFGPRRGFGHQEADTSQLSATVLPPSTAYPVPPNSRYQHSGQNVTSPPLPRPTRHATLSKLARFREAKHERRHLRCVRGELEAHVLAKVTKPVDAGLLDEAIVLVEGNRSVVFGMD